MWPSEKQKKDVVARSDLEAEKLRKEIRKRREITPDKRASGVIKIEERIRSHRATW